MKKEIEKIVNAWWNNLKSIEEDLEEYEADSSEFIYELEQLFPDMQFKFDGDKWFISLVF